MNTILKQITFEKTITVIVKFAHWLKKRLLYIINPPKRIITNPKFIRVLKVLVILIIIYLLLVIFNANAAYNFSQKNQYSQTIEKMFPYPVATVGKKVILLSRLKSDYVLVNNFIETSKTSDRYEQNNILKNLFDRLIECRIIEKIAQTNGIYVTKEEINQAWNTILIEQEGLGDVDQILKDIYGVEEAQIKNFISETLLKEKVEALPKKRHVKHILITFNKDDANSKNQTRAKIDEIKNKINNGTKFEDAAKEFSQDLKSKDVGGDVGWLDVAYRLDNQEEKGFIKTIFKTPINQVSEISETHLGFHLIISTEERGSINKSMKQLIDEQRTGLKIIRFVQF